MPRMKPMDAVVRVLEDEGVTVAFGVPGAAILPLYDSLRGSSIRHISRAPRGGRHALRRRLGADHRRAGHLHRHVRPGRART